MSLGIETQPPYYSPFYLRGTALLEAEFGRALQLCEAGRYVQRPSAIDILRKNRRRLIDNMKEANRQIELEMQKRASATKGLDGSLSQLTALDLAARSILLQQRLRNSGALYGNKEFNFCITNVDIPREVYQAIITAAQEAFLTLQTLQPLNIAKFQTNAEDYAESLKLTPNGARIDIILTNDGPKVIEANLQWVDAIQALEGLQISYKGQTKGKTPTGLLARCFTGRKRLAIVELSKGTGTRASGAQAELEVLAKTLAASNSFTTVEIIDPEKTLPRYLSAFDAFYINGEPRMITTTESPDWLIVIFEKVKRQSAQMFPNWCPAADKKTNLVLASKASLVFAPTLPFSENNLALVRRTSRAVIKGDGFSSNNVALEGDTNFSGLLEDARLFPEDYVIQPKLDSTALPPIFVYDTSSEQPRLLANPQSKINVWIIGGMVAGVMVSVSDKEIISDKDYCSVPIIT